MKLGKASFKGIHLFRKLRGQNISLDIGSYPFGSSFKHLLTLRVIAPGFLIVFLQGFMHIYDLSN